MRRRENQAITHTDIPNAVARLAAIRAVACTRPNLNFVLAFNRTCL